MRTTQLRFETLERRDLLAADISLSGGIVSIDADDVRIVNSTSVGRFHCFQRRPEQRNNGASNRGSRRNSHFIRQCGN